MGQYIVTYNGLGSDNSILVSSQIALDFDVGTNGVNDFLTTLEDEALSKATGFNGAVTRVSIVRIYTLQ
ncbi:hypothetical protein KKJ13_15805 [Xenorhabdus bovienii]|uniref:hypothetical protein n=1 Tax=Xenorhabdus bovienii TaxID=40576 RepID=UPI0023B33DD1|nr:hypothetical protein [Xenorhabdus bovienii]MDE9443031.1 hypothetical protein [Xenorhabdus bovienii]MDE9467269.1 hypothetical protein [Xenorhabdus bovienii]